MAFGEKAQSQKVEKKNWSLCSYVECSYLFQLFVVVVRVVRVVVRVPAPELEHALGNLLHLVVVHAPRAPRDATRLLWRLRPFQTPATTLNAPSPL